MSSENQKAVRRFSSLPLSSFERANTDENVKKEKETVVAINPIERS
jgi:hypothetical protein